MVLVSTLFAVTSLLLAPHRGLCSRLFRRWRFQMRCVEENMLKALWKAEKLSWNEMRSSYPWFGRSLLWRMERQGWVERERKSRKLEEFVLTSDGKKRASNLVRLHRLWELYLSSNLGFSPLDVHRNAEEIEHILTPEFEARLTHLLDNPTHDPHEQPIPERHL
jgi:manganese/zinc/iron transport system permease protein